MNTLIKVVVRVIRGSVYYGIKTLRQCTLPKYALPFFLLHIHVPRSTHLPPHCALTTRLRKPPKKLSRKLNHSIPTCPTPISKSIFPSRSNLFLQCHVYLSITYFIAWLPIIFLLSHKYRRLRRQGARSYNTVVVVEIRHQSERDFFATYYINTNLLLQTLRINTTLTLFNTLLITSLIKIRRCRPNLCALITKL